MKLTYEKNGDYLIPNLTANEEPEGTLTKYGMMRKNFLQEHRKGIYQGMILAGELKAHCLEIQEQAEQRMEALSEQMAKAECASLVGSEMCIRDRPYGKAII